MTPEELVKQHLSDPDYYEKGEPHPTQEVITQTIDILSNLSQQVIDEADFVTWYGECHVDWEANNKSVKVMLTRDGRFLIWYAKVENGRVIEHNMIRDGTIEKLTEQLAWMKK